MTKIAFLNYQINGSKGPYNENTNIGKAANAGNEFATLLKNGNFSQLKNSDIQYSNMDWGYNNGRQYFKMPDPKVSVRSGLAYSTEALKGYDSNKDGTVSTDEFNSYFLSKKAVGKHGEWMINPDSLKYGQTVDLNGDNKIDAGELTAWQVYQDGMKQIGHDGINYSTSFDKSRVDGKVTAKEAQLAEGTVSSDPSAAKAELQKIYNENNIADAQRTFKMPPKVNQNPFPPNQNITQMLMNLLQQLLGGLGGIIQPR